MQIISYHLIAVFAAIQLVSGLQVDPNYAKQIKESASKCKTLLNLSDEFVKELFKSGNLLDSEEKKCFLACLMEEGEIIKDNTYNWEAHIKANKLKYLDPADNEKSTQVVMKCKEKVTPNDDKCQLAYDIKYCDMIESREVDLKQPQWN